MREASEMIATAENEWQRYTELEDPSQRSMYLGTVAMGKAMALAAILLSLRRAAGIPDDGGGQAT